MHTIALVNQKGGVGKTTVALHLATALQHGGENVLVVDLDPQASAAEWHDARSEPMPHVESVQPARLDKVIEHARSIGISVLILDTAPHIESTVLEASRAADLVLVPCQATIKALRAMRKTIRTLQLVKKPAFAVLNEVPASGSDGDEAAETIQALGFPVCPVRLGARKIYHRSSITGQTAQEVEPGGKAAEEVAHLHMWTCAQLGLSTGGHVEMCA